MSKQTESNTPKKKTTFSNKAEIYQYSNPKDQFSESCLLDNTYNSEINFKSSGLTNIQSNQSQQNFYLRHLKVIQQAQKLLKRPVNFNASDKKQQEEYIPLVNKSTKNPTDKPQHQFILQEKKNQQNGQIISTNPQIKNKDLKNIVQEQPTLYQKLQKKLQQLPEVKIKSFDRKRVTFNMDQLQKIIQGYDNQDKKKQLQYYPHNNRVTINTYQLTKLIQRQHRFSKQLENMPQQNIKNELQISQKSSFKIQMEMQIYFNSTTQKMNSLKQQNSLLANKLNLLQTQQQNLGKQINQKNKQLFETKNRLKFLNQNIQRLRQNISDEKYNYYLEQLNKLQEQIGAKIIEYKQSIQNTQFFGKFIIGWIMVKANRQKNRQKAQIKMKYSILNNETIFFDNQTTLIILKAAFQTNYERSKTLMGIIRGLSRTHEQIMHFQYEIKTLSSIFTFTDYYLNTQNAKFFFNFKLLPTTTFIFQVDFTKLSSKSSFIKILNNNTKTYQLFEHQRDQKNLDEMYKPLHKSLLLLTRKYNK